MSEQELELQARTALLEYYGSLMQSYKTFILTIAVSALTAIQILLTIFARNPTQLAIFLSSTLGGTIGGMLFCAWRWLWCGHIITSAINVPTPVEGVTMRILDDQMKRHAYNSERWELPEIWMNLMRKGDNKILLLMISAVLSFGLASVIFLGMTQLLSVCLYFALRVVLLITGFILIAIPVCYALLSRGQVSVTSPVSSAG